MRRIWALIVVVAMCLPLYGGSKREADSRFPVQHRSMHAIVFENDKERGLCTATAIGPHALLTAAHCEIDEENLDGSKILLFVDPVGKPDYLLAQTPYEIKGAIEDGNEHRILLVSGPAFPVVVPYEVSAGYQGQEVAWFGNPAGLRDQFRDGYVTGFVTEKVDDKSVKTGFWLVAAPCIGGDSGSAVFDVKTKKLVGLVTYGVFNGSTMGMYPLLFSQTQIATAQHYGQ